MSIDAVRQQAYNYNEFVFDQAVQRTGGLRVMLLSTMTNYLCSLYGDKKAIEMIAEAGFDAVDYSMLNFEDPKGILAGDDYRKKAEKVREMAEDCGLVINQCHAPFDFNYSDPAGFGYATKMLRRSLEIAGILGAKNVVVHPLHYRRYKENAAFVHFENVKWYRSMLPAAKECGVTICAENMWQWNSDQTKILPDECSFPDEFSFLVDEVGGKNFGACLDLGHAALTAQDVGWTTAEFIRKLGKKRLKALHVHDNDGVSDMHTAPYLGTVDWDEITKALKKIRYEGDFTFEADSFLKYYPKEFIPTALKYLHDTGRMLMAQIV